MSPKKTAWEQYLEKGWNVIPIYGVVDGICQCKHGETCESPGKHPKVPWRSYQKIEVKPQRALVWFRDPQTNVGIITGEISNLVVIDEDRSGAADFLNLPPTLTVQTREGRRHYYFKHPGHTIKSGRIGEDLDIKGDGGYVVAPPSRHVSGSTYEFINPDQPLADFPQSIIDHPQKDVTRARDALKGVPEGERDVAVFRYACDLRGRGFEKEEAEILVLQAAASCDPPFPETQARRKLKEAYTYPTNREKSTTQDDVSQSRKGIPPPPLNGVAFSGLAGELVGTLEPYTEAHPTGILFSFLTGFGNRVNRSPHIALTKAEVHYPNLYTAIVGHTGSSRKGTAWNDTRPFLEPPPDPPARTQSGKYKMTFPWNVKVGGLSSGEGVIHEVRDDTIVYDDKEGDWIKVPGSGSPNKTCLFFEPEFVSALTKSTNSRSVLWETLKAGWDSGKLDNTTKNSSITATNAHISLLVNVTPSGLRNHYSIGHHEGGLTNRFLWAYVPEMEEEKLRPLPSPMPAEMFNTLYKKVQDAIEFGKQQKALTLDPGVEEWWQEKQREFFRKQKSDIELIRQLLVRVRSQIYRLAIIYAILDKSETIRQEHLESAIAVWDYSEKTAIYLFGEAVLTSPLANKMWNFLEECGGEISRSELTSKFNYYAARDRDEAIQKLEDSGIIAEQKKPNRRGPATTVIQLLKTKPTEV